MSYHSVFLQQTLGLAKNCDLNGGRNSGTAHIRQRSSPESKDAVLPVYLPNRIAHRGVLMLITNGDLLGCLCLKLRLDLEWKCSYQ